MSQTESSVAVRTLRRPIRLIPATKSIGRCCANRQRNFEYYIAHEPEIFERHSGDIAIIYDGGKRPLLLGLKRLSSSFSIALTEASAICGAPLHGPLVSRRLGVVSRVFRGTFGPSVYTDADLRLRFHTAPSDQNHHSDRSRAIHSSLPDRHWRRLHDRAT